MNYKIDIKKLNKQLEKLVEYCQNNSCDHCLYKIICPYTATIITDEIYLSVFGESILKDDNSEPEVDQNTADKYESDSSLKTEYELQFQINIGALDRVKSLCLSARLGTRNKTFEGELLKTERILSFLMEKYSILLYKTKYPREAAEKYPNDLSDLEAKIDEYCKLLSENKLYGENNI